MGGRIQSNHSVPGLVVESVGNCQIVSSQVKRLFHVSKAQAEARIVRLGVELQDFFHDVIGDGREEDPR